MALTSLLVCADAEAVQVLSRILRELGIEAETCGDTRLARFRVDQHHFDAIFVDCCHESAALEFIAHAREASCNPAVVVIAMVNGRNQVRDIFAQGANFVLYKPISPERAAHSVRAARSLIRRERRIQPRIPVDSRVCVSYAGKEDVSAALVDLNENGLGIQTEDRFPPSCKVYFQFALPKSQAMIRLSGEVMWQDSAGRVGIRFVQVPQTSRRVLSTWVQTELSANAGKQSAPGPDDWSLRLSAGLGLLSVSAADRRDRSRYACTMGAEVYRAESNVPHRCTLSDIGPGGCYVETTEPFPAGAPVEIVVRAPDFKVCVAGKVRNVNPGFGMGVVFNLTREAQQKQVEQLIACAKADPKLVW